LPTDELWVKDHNGAMNICSAVGKNIRKLRTSKKLTQDDLAVKAKMDRAYLSEVESGSKNIGLKVLDKISTALDVKVAALFAGYKNN
jgi:transcriptional regulator with XRE-family HTH domain